MITPTIEGGNVIVLLSNTDCAVGIELGPGTFVVDILVLPVDKLDVLVIMLGELFSKVVLT